MARARATCPRSRLYESSSQSGLPVGIGRLGAKGKPPSTWYTCVRHASTLLTTHWTAWDQPCAQHSPKFRVFCCRLSHGRVPHSWQPRPWDTKNTTRRVVISGGNFECQLGVNLVSTLVSKYPNRRWLISICSMPEFHIMGPNISASAGCVSST